VIAGLAAAAVLVFGQMAFAEDLLSGTWKLNLAKSKYNLGPPPKSGMTKFQVTGDVIKTVADNIDVQGRVIHNEYTARFDGKDYPWKGTIDGRPNPNQDAVMWRKFDDYTYEFTNKLRGNALATFRIVISRDGKTRTNTLTGQDSQGRTASNVTVWERQ
jgi:hypothetical protein